MVTVNDIKRTWLRRAVLCVVAPIALPLGLAVGACSGVMGSLRDFRSAVADVWRDRT